MSSGIQYFNSYNFDLILNLHGVIGENYHYQGFPELNYLWMLNRLLSTSPWGEIVDRSGQTAYPFQVHNRCPWQGPLENMDLETTCSYILNDIIKNNPGPYYVYWSGGIDSTLILTTFLKEVDLSDFVVCCSTASIDEHPEFYKKFIQPNCRVIDTNLEIPLDGTHITGDCGDTAWAVLDSNVLNNPVSTPYLYRPWQEWASRDDFKSILAERDIHEDLFFEYLTTFFKKSGREIVTLFDARWWFYLLCKGQSKALYKTAGSFNLFPNINFVHFFEHQYMDSWSWYNNDKIIVGDNWNTYKQPAKEIIFKFDGNEPYRKYKSKGYSSGLEYNRRIKDLTSLLRMPLFITDDNQRPTLSTAPFFSNIVYQQECYEQHRHLFTPMLGKK
jgi:hypothetical protein